MAKALSGREQVRRWRERHEIGLADLARRIGYKSHAALWRWEEGKGSLPTWRLILLERETGIPAEVLAGKRQADEVRIIKGAK